jgi:N6-L-threonylcarbamoyladenine synthase
MLHSKNLDFSFSGLKTAVLTLVKKHGAHLSDTDKANISRAFVDAIVEVLTAKCLAALKQTGLKRLVIAGGVGANHQLRLALNAAAERKRFEVFYPELALCTDNGAMIAFAAALRLNNKLAVGSHDYSFNVKPRWPLDAIDAIDVKI